MTERAPDDSGARFVFAAGALPLFPVLRQNAYRSRSVVNRPRSGPPMVGR